MSESATRAVVHSPGACALIRTAGVLRSGVLLVRTRIGQYDQRRGVDLERTRQCHDLGKTQLTLSALDAVQGRFTHPGQPREDGTDRPAGVSALGLGAAAGEVMPAARTTHVIHLV